MHTQILKFYSLFIQVDDVIKSCIIALNTKKPETPPKKEVQQEKSDSDSDSDSDPGVASPDRMVSCIYLQR